jgi:YgiT-type zinc finger domain-containing protein
MNPQPNIRPVPCPRCGHAMRPAVTKTAIWIEDRVFIVEDVPAQVCDQCVEQYYDDDTTEAIRRLTEEGFPPAEVKREILVPIFSLEKRIPAYDTRPPAEYSQSADPSPVKAGE